MLLGRWDRAKDAGVGDAASDTAAGFPFLQVELPSRRWYIEASADSGGMD